ncbi:MAG: translation elongation factor Ts [Candidatus Izemoplasmatales bacterium]
MDITASMVKELREKTGAGMMDCKRALMETAGDLDKASEWLREKGILKAAKRTSRVAAEGVSDVAVDGNRGVVFELNCETDFVAKTDKFRALVNQVRQWLLQNPVSNEEEALALEIDGKKMSEHLLEAISGIGENITLRRVQAVEKQTEETFGTYIHMGGKIATLTVLSQADFDTAKDVAMHVAANNPLYLSMKSIPEDVLAHEKDILTKEAINENETAVKPKPESILMKIVEGRLQKNMKDICLLNQPFVKNPDQTIEEYTKAKGAVIVHFVRMAVGEGIEKKCDNFAEEVLSQVNQ